MAFGLDMACPNLKRNLGAYLDMVRIKDSCDKTGCDLINKTLEERVRFKCVEIARITTSNIDAKGIAAILNYEDVYDVHDCDKIGNSVIRGLVRTRNKVWCFSIFATFKFYLIMIQFLNLSFIFSPPSYLLRHQLILLREQRVH